MRHYIRVYSCIGASHGRWVNNQHLHGYIIYTTSARVAQGVLYNSFRSFSPCPPFFFFLLLHGVFHDDVINMLIQISGRICRHASLFICFFFFTACGFFSLSDTRKYPSFMMESVFFYFIFIIIIFCCCTHSKESFPLGTTIRGFYLGFYFSIR